MAEIRRVTHASGLHPAELVSPAGFEPTAPGLGILCSILLSYGDAGLPYRTAPSASPQNPRWVCPRLILP